MSSSSTFPVDKPVEDTTVFDQQTSVTTEELQSNVNVLEEGQCLINNYKMQKGNLANLKAMKIDDNDPNEQKLATESSEKVNTKISEATSSKSKETKNSEGRTKLKVATTQTEIGVKYKMTPILRDSSLHAPSKVAVPRRNPPLSAAPVANERPLVLATHLVPSLPISLFEVLQEAIEVATGKSVVLLYEPRSDRPVAKSVTDIAILPATEEWDEGELLPVSFCFEHRLNKSNSPRVYADVIVTADRAAHIEDIMDLRGHRCSLPDRRKKLGAAALLFDHLYTRGESPAFFGNTLDASTQMATLQMVAGKQAEMGILEAPVIKCQKNSLPGVESVHILASLGPLPPYRFMANKSLPDTLVRKISAYLLNIDRDKEWLEKFAPFGVTRFSANSRELYEIGDLKSVVTSVPYY